MNKWKIIRYSILIPLIIIAVYTFYPHLNDFKQLFLIRNSLNFFWVIIAILSQGSQYLEDGYFAKRILKIINFDIKLKDTIRVASIDVFATHLFPVGQFGPLAANLYFYKKLGLDNQAVIFFNLILSVTGVFVLIALFLLSSITIPNKTLPFPIHIYLLTIFLSLFVLIIVAIIFATRINAFREFAKNLLKRFEWFEELNSRLENWRKYRSLMIKHRSKFLTLAAIKSLLYYAGDIVTLGSCFLAFHTFPSISLIVFAYILSQIAGSISLIPAGLGSTDITLGVIFLASHINPGVTVGVILLYRIVSFLLPIPLGAFSYYSLGRKFKTAIPDS